MKTLIQNFKRPLLLTAVATMFAAGFSDFGFGIQSAEAADIQDPAGMQDSNAESRSQEFLVADNHSASDSDITAQNWDTPGGPDADAVAPSNDMGMAAAKWRSLEQPVVSQSEFAAENWKNPGDAAPISKQSSEHDMATENWGVER